MLNKIVIDGKSISKNSQEDKVFTIENDGEYLLQNIEKDLIILVSPSLNVHFLFCKENINHRLQFEVGTNAFCQLSYYNVNSSDNIVVNLQEKARLDLSYRIICRKRCEVEINVNHLGKNSFSKVLFHGLNESDELLLCDLTSKVLKEVEDCRVVQNAKIINVNDLATSIIKPKLLIDLDNVEASHSAYLGSFKEEELFCLATLGISESDAKWLLKKAFFLGEIEDNSYVERFCLEHLKK